MSACVEDKLEFNPFASKASQPIRLRRKQVKCSSVCVESKSRMYTMSHPSLFFDGGCSGLAGSIFDYSLGVVPVPARAERV